MCRERKEGAVCNVVREGGVPSPCSISPLPPSLHSMQVGSYTYIHEFIVCEFRGRGTLSGPGPMCVVLMRGGNILVPRTGITLSFVFRSYVGNYIS